MLDARHVANELIRLSQARRSPRTAIQIQNMVYLAHARKLSLHREPLVDQPFEACECGPVVRSLYNALAPYKGEPRLTETLPVPTEANLSLKDRSIIAWSFAQYGHLADTELSKLTHAPGAPWDGARRSSSRSNPTIENDAIEQYYWEEWDEEVEAERERIHKDPNVQAAITDGFAQIDRGECRAVGSQEELQGIFASRADPR